MIKNGAIYQSESKLNESNEPDTRKLRMPSIHLEKIDFDYPNSLQR